MGFVVGVPSHVLEGRHVLRYLDGLHDEQHGDPDELQEGPEREGDGPGVAEDEGAEVGGQNVARIRV